jgi:hypothetical protein
MKAFALALALALVMALATTSAANKIGLAVGGDRGNYAVVIDAVRPWLEARGYGVSIPALSDDALGKMVSCFIENDTRCAGSVVADAATDRLLFIMVEFEPSADGGTDRFTLTAWLFSSDPGETSMAAARRECAACAASSLAEASRELVATVTGDPGSRSGTVAVDSTPTGARVSIDDKAVGIAPIEYKLAPGSHAVAVDLPGHERELRSIHVIPGASQRLSLALRPIQAPAARPSWPWWLLGAGAAVVTTGAILIAIDEDAPGNRTYTDTAMSGAVTTAIGAAALGAGIYFLWRRPAAESAPVATIRSSGAFIGWSGHF